MEKSHCIKNGGGEKCSSGSLGGALGSRGWWGVGSQGVEGGRRDGGLRSFRALVGHSEDFSFYSVKRESWGFLSWRIT